LDIGGIFIVHVADFCPIAKENGSHPNNWASILVPTDTRLLLGGLGVGYIAVRSFVEQSELSVDTQLTRTTYFLAVLIEFSKLPKWLHPLHSGNGKAVRNMTPFIFARFIVLLPVHDAPCMYLPHVPSTTVVRGGTLTMQSLDFFDMSVQFENLASGGSRGGLSSALGGGGMVRNGPMWGGAGGGDITTSYSSGNGGGRLNGANSYALPHVK
jgi:hypothetical protein